MNATIRAADLQTLIDALPHLVWVCHADGQAEYFNARWREYTGLDLAASRGDGWRGAVHPEQASELATAWRRVGDDAHEWHVLYRLRRHDGVYRWFEARARRVLLESDIRPHWIGTSTDIDDQRRALDTVQAQERRYRALIEYLPDAFFVHDETGVILDVNRHASELTGRSRDRLLALRIADLDAHFDDATLRTQWQAATPGASWEAHSLARHADGRIINIDAHVVCYRYGDQKLFLSLVRDATARLAEDAVLRQRSALLDLAPVMVFDLDGRIHFWSRGAEALAGYGRAEAESSTVSALLKPQFPMPFKALVEQLQRTGEWCGEIGATVADGRKIVALSQWTLYHDEQLGKPLILQVHVDFTELKRAERALAASREEVRAYSQHLDQAVEAERLHIARELHDELGQRLTTLKIDLHWLLDHVAGHALFDPASIGRLHAMQTIIDETITETRSLSASLRPIGLEQLGLKSALESMVAAFATRTGLRAHASIDGSAHVPVEHKLVVYRIVQEALTNVARHSGASEVEVLLGTVDDTVRVEVHDNGVGLAPASDQRTRLGIVGMRERARAIGASLDIVSDDGTSVILEIPR